MASPQLPQHSQSPRRQPTDSELFAEYGWAHGSDAFNTADTLGRRPQSDDTLTTAVVTELVSDTASLSSATTVSSLENGSSMHRSRHRRVSSAASAAALIEPGMVEAAGAAAAGGAFQSPTDAKTHDIINKTNGNAASLHLARLARWIARSSHPVTSTSPSPPPRQRRKAQACRTKLLQCLVVAILSALFIGIIEAAGSYLAPRGRDFSLEELAAMRDANVPYVAVNGRVMDFASSSMMESTSTADSMAEQIRDAAGTYRGLDMSAMFPAFATLLAQPVNGGARFADPDMATVVGATAAPAVDAWLAMRLAQNDGYVVNATTRRLATCPAPSGAAAGPCFTAAASLLADSAVGYVVHDRATIQQNHGDLNSPTALVIIDSMVYDVTWYLRLATSWGQRNYTVSNNGSIASGSAVTPESSTTTWTPNSATAFLPTDMTAALLANLGSTASAAFDNQPDRAARVRVMNKLMFAGVLRDALPPRASRMNPVMLVVGGLIYVLYIVKISMTLAQSSSDAKNSFSNDVSLDKPAPFNVVLIPVYNESAVTMQKAIESAVNSDYAADRKLVVVVVDGLAVQPGESHRDSATAVRGILGYAGKVPAEVEYESVGTGARRLNVAQVYAGRFNNGNAATAAVPYVVIVKSGARGETRLPGTRGKRDSMLILMQYLSAIVGVGGEDTLGGSNHYYYLSPLERALHTALTDDLALDPNEFEYLTVMDGDTTMSRDAMTALAGVLRREHATLAVHGCMYPASMKMAFWSLLQAYPWFHTHHLAPALDSAIGAVGRAWSGGFATYRIVLPTTKATMKIAGQQKTPCLVARGILDALAERPQTTHERNRLWLGEDRSLPALLLAHHDKTTDNAPQLAYCPTAIATTRLPTTFCGVINVHTRTYTARLHTLAHLIKTTRSLSVPRRRISLRVAAVCDAMAMLLAPAATAFLYFMIARTIFYTAVKKCPSMALVHSDVLINLAFAALAVLQCVLLLLAAAAASRRALLRMVLPVLVYQVVGMLFWQLVVPVVALWRADWGNMWCDSVPVDGRCAVRPHGADGDGDGDDIAARAAGRDKRKYSNGPAMVAVPFSVPARRSTVAPFPAAEMQPHVESEFASLFDAAAVPLNRPLATTSTSAATVATPAATTRPTSQNSLLSLTSTIVPGGSRDGFAQRSNTLNSAVTIAMPFSPSTASVISTAAFAPTLTRPPSDTLSPRRDNYHRYHSPPPAPHAAFLLRNSLASNPAPPPPSSSSAFSSLPRIVSGTTALSSRYHSGTNSTRTSLATSRRPGSVDSTTTATTESTTTTRTTSSSLSLPPPRANRERSALRHAVREQVSEIISMLERQQQEQQQQQEKHGVPYAHRLQRELALRFGDALVNDFGGFIEECVEEVLLERMALV
ncbi:hypothetical protein HDU89_001183 [Geranomyces variabilis]|nr:hypothetical protein HDU89_001183 [Geranomyces variabilis]